jgi:DNA repair protein RadC
MPTLMVKKGTGYRAATEEEILQAARAVMSRRFKRGAAITSPDAAWEFLQVQLGPRAYECFAVIWLDNQHRIIRFEELSRGTVNGASVHAREVLRAAIERNAAACILAHNHPSGVAEPSPTDLWITRHLKETLGQIDVRVLDHVIVGEGTPCSLAKRGLM